LREKGIKTDSIVGIMVERSVEMITGILGILEAGGAYLPIDPEYPEERIIYMLSDSNVKMLVTTGNLAREAVKVRRWKDKTYYIEEMLSSSYPLTFLPSNLQKTSHPATGHWQPATSLSYLIYTSGSTGRAKAVVVEHASVVNLLYAMQEEYPFTSRDTYLLKTSYIFDVSVTELFGWYMEGGRVSVLSKGAEKDTQAIIASIEKNGVSHINFVPSMFNVFVSQLDCCPNM
jgi:non-ribosomal peptide synthetase component F